MKKMILLLVIVAFACSMLMSCAATEACTTDQDDCKDACEKASESSVENNCKDACSDEYDDCVEAAGCSGS